MSGQDAKPGAYLYKVSAEDQRDLGFIVIPVSDSNDRKISAYLFNGDDEVIKHAASEFKIISSENGAANLLENTERDEGFLRALIQFFDPNTSVQIIKVEWHGKGKNPVVLYYEVRIQDQDIVLSKVTSLVQASIHAKSEVARINRTRAAEAKDPQLSEKRESLHPYRVRLGRASSL
ncbi:hypothetical protein [uncultured Xanthomonas sp.]|uniref:hypothetical protein n=1 Tax=uncultured Xanthomonas sp. TaxID=152831 RepID=UPI0025E8ADEF|nr:hypothetical protein [uncultured Xanthomonas sp.]